MQDTYITRKNGGIFMLHADIHIYIYTCVSKYARILCAYACAIMRM